MTIYIVQVQYMVAVQLDDERLAIVADSPKQARAKARKEAASSGIWSTEIIATHSVDKIITL